MNLITMFKTINFYVITNAFKLKSGAYALISVPFSVSIFEGLKLIFKDVKNESIVMPILATTILLMIYFVFFMVDFATGMIASKYESKNNPDWVKSSKLYNSIGKIAGVLLVDIIFLVIILFLVGLKYETISQWILVILVLINVLAILYEYHSIGENWKRRTGVLPPLFAFFDRITTLIEDKIIGKIDKNLD